MSEGLAGHLLELAMGSTYDNLLKSRIEDPLGFKYTGIRLNEIQRYRLARGHSGIEQMKLIEMLSLPGVANVRSSAMDLAVLLQIALGIREHNLRQHFVRLEEPEAIEMPLSIEALERYVGVYAFNKDKVMIITRISDRLYANELEKPRHPIFAESEDRFHYPNLDAVIDFEYDANARDPVLILRKGDIVWRARKVKLKQG